MRAYKVVSLTSRQQFLVQDKEGQFWEYPIEGFKVSSNLAHRLLLADFLGQDIECTLNKAATHIRYINEPFLTRMLALGAMTVVAKELEQSRIYSPDVKARFAAVTRSEEADPKVVDLLAKRRDLLKHFPRDETIEGKIEFLSSEIVVSIVRQGELIYVPFRLRNINTLFEFLPETVTAPFLAANSTLKVRLERPIYNLVQKRFELFGKLYSELELEILKKGWGVVNTEALSESGEDWDAEDYLKAESAANEAHLGVFNRSSQILSFIYAKNNFVGDISDVLDGYIFEVTRKPSGERIKIELAMARSPIGDEVGAFNCREFARKQLIGQEVNVFLHKDSGLNITGSLIRAKDSKDVESLMVEQGWAYVREEFLSSALCLKLSELEKKAKEKGRGLHSKDVGVHRPEDLTVPNSQKEEIYTYRRLEVLKRMVENEVGVLEGMIDIVHYKVWLEEKNVLLKVQLSGVISPNLSPLLEEVKRMKEDSKELYERRFKKRSVNLIITDYHKENNSFIGTVIFPGHKTLQEILLEESFVYVEREGASRPEYKQAENRGRASGKGVWTSSLLKFEPVNPLDLLGTRFKGKFSWIQDGETVYVQPESNDKTLELIGKKLNGNLKKATKDQIVNGALLAAPYEGEAYRVLVMGVKGKRIKVLFVDWGNKEWVEEKSLWQLPAELQLIEKQSLKLRLFLTKPIRTHEYLDRLRGELMDGEVYEFKKEQEDYVSVYRKKQYINVSLVEKGLIKSNQAKASPDLKILLQRFEENLHTQKVGIWEWSSDEEDNGNEEDD